MKLFPVLIVLAGCGFDPAPKMVVGSSCKFGDTRLEIEAGSYWAQPPQVLVPQHAEFTGFTSPDQVCAYLVANSFQPYRDAYESYFGHQDLSNRVVRWRATKAIEGDSSVCGTTYSDAIDLASNCSNSLAHELNHVREGPGHYGWCKTYNPWSIAVLGWDQSAYLGCGKTVIVKDGGE